MNTLNWLKEHGALLLLAVLLLGFCWAAHSLVVVRLEERKIGDPMLTIKGARTVAAIGYINTHPAAAVFYFGLWTTYLLYAEWRGFPRWARWLMFGVLAAPCVAYLASCVAVLNKWIF